MGIVKEKVNNSLYLDGNSLTTSELSRAVDNYDVKISISDQTKCKFS